MFVAACANALPAVGRGARRRQLNSDGGGYSELQGGRGVATALREQHVAFRVNESHPIDVVISDKEKSVFVDNVKAASTTVRSLRRDKLNVTWWDGCDGKYWGCCSRLGRCA